MLTDQAELHATPRSIEEKIMSNFQLLGQFQRLAIGLVIRLTVDVAGQNKRGAGLIDQHTVCFIHYGET